VETRLLEASQPHSLDGLRQFLRERQVRARERGTAQLASISLPAERLDPLAVLEAIYDPAAPHIYVQKRAAGFAMAGAETAVSFQAQGPDRFAAVKRFVQDTLANTVAVGDERLPGFGPRFFAGFAFFAAPEPGAAFAPATVFVPRWEVAAGPTGCVAVANAQVGPDADVEALARRIWKAHARLARFDASVPATSSARQAALEARELGGPADEAAFRRRVKTALEEIGRGDYEKIVLARELALEASQPFHPLGILNALRDRYPDCYAFSFGNGQGRSFIGASPERLLKVESGRLETEALAGSAPRGATALEDARLGAGLLASEKDRREQRIVLEDLLRRLEALGLEPEAAPGPVLKRLQNVQHLLTEVMAPMPPGPGLLDALEALHPTPAVGGSPREAALGRIAALDGFCRGLYGGPIGWIDGREEGEFLVGIRSGLVSGEALRLYAGVGIVAGSQPEIELEETRLKLKALRENLL